MPRVGSLPCSACQACSSWKRRRHCRCGDSLGTHGPPPRAAPGHHLAALVPRLLQPRDRRQRLFLCPRQGAFPRQDIGRLQWSSRCCLSMAMRSQRPKKLSVGSSEASTAHRNQLKAPPPVGNPGSEANPSAPRMRSCHETPSHTLQWPSQRSVGPQRASHLSVKHVEVS